jgi:hypothetical protein
MIKMYFWFVSTFLGVGALIFLGDIALIKRKYMKTSGVIQTMSIADNKDNIIEDLIARNDAYHTVYNVGSGCLHSREYPRETQIHALNVFAETVRYFIKNNKVKEELKRLRYITLWEILTSYWWIHSYVYGTEERNKYTDIALSSLIHLLKEMETFHFLHVALLELDNNHPEITPALPI